MKPWKKDIDEILKRGLPSASADSKEQVEDLGDRVLRRLRAIAPNGEAAQQNGVVNSDEEGSSDSPRAVQGLRWPRLVAMAGAIAAAVVIPMTLPWSAPATLESASGVRRVEYDSLVRAADSAGGVLVLTDGSRVEMRSGTELRLEQAEDGTRIRLNSGSVIVNAAKRRTGHLYVQTKDVNVSVVGTVFLVNAEEEGSRVAVIEGEVRVQQGRTEQKLRRGEQVITGPVEPQPQQLLPGEQVSTSPSLAMVPVREEISWSRNAAAHMALLRQSAFVRTSTVFQNPADPTLVFDVVSIRPRDSSGGGGGGRGGGGAAPPACGGSPPSIDPGRFVVTNITLYRLIAIAYGLDCAALEVSGVELLSGGPDWIRSDKFDVEALLPKGAPTYTRQDLSIGNAPKLQLMLQTLLADRFKLTIHRMLKELPSYALTAASAGPKLPPWKDGDPTAYGVNTGLNADGQISTAIFGKKLSMEDLARQLSLVTRRPVLNRTDLAGEFNYAFEFAAPDDYPGVREMRATGRWTFLVGPSLFTAIEEQLGLKLVATRAPVEVLMIERVEKPSEN